MQLLRYLSLMNNCPKHYQLLLEVHNLKLCFRFDPNSNITYYRQDYQKLKQRL